MPSDLCEWLLEAWNTEVRTYDGPLMRQLTSREEPHDRSPDGWVTNPVANPRRLVQFPEFCWAEEVAMRGAPVVSIAEHLLGGPPALLQAAYVESSRGSLPHLDFNPVDPTRPMIGMWVALEDIGPGAGRFFVLPKSHTMPVDDELTAFAELAWDNYRQAFIDKDPHTAEAEAQERLARLVARHGLEIETPALDAGDIIIWTRSLIHGSHLPEPGGGSRNSLLLHFVELDLLREHGLVPA